jgi:DNA-binding NtrC family response regulator
MRAQRSEAPRNDRMAIKKRILIISDGSSTGVIQEATKNWLVLETIVCSSVHEARSHLVDSDIHLIFCNNCMPDGSYLHLLELLRSLTRDVPVILIVPVEDRDFKHREAWAQGVFDIVASPCSRQDVQWMIIRTMQHLKAQESILRAKTSYAS